MIKSNHNSIKCEWKKCIIIQILCTNNFNNNDKNNHNVHIIIDENYESDSDKSHKYSKN